MRNYLKQLNIVSAVLFFREGEIAKIHIDFMMKHVDKMVAMFDNQDDETEKIVLEQKKKYGDKLIIGYSNFPRLKSENKEHSLNRRFKKHEGEIRQRLLDLVKKEHNKKNIDILLWLDADEIFIDQFPAILEKFWQQDKPALMCRHIQIINDFYTIHNRRFYSHCRAFKYGDNMTTIPMNARSMVNPFNKGEFICKVGHVIVHLADYNKKYVDKRFIYKRRLFKDDVFVWKSEKDARSLTEKEYSKLLNSKPFCKFSEYTYE